MKSTIGELTASDGCWAPPNYDRLLPVEKKQDKNAKHEELSRRAFMVQAAELFAVYSFYQIAHQSFAWAKPIEPIVRQWVKQLDEICNAVHQGKLSPQDWQTAMEQLHAKIPLADVLKFVDLDRVLEKIQYPRARLGENCLPVTMQSAKVAASRSV